MKIQSAWAASVTSLDFPSLSVISKYLGMMESAGLLESARFGKWTYYRRNEENIRKFARYVARDL